MSAEANKKLVQQVYADSANRSGTTFADNLADDASWIVTGHYSWSHEFKGRDAILNGLLGHFRFRIETVDALHKLVLSEASACEAG